MSYNLQHEEDLGDGLYLDDNDVLLVALAAEAQRRGIRPEQYARLTPKMIDAFKAKGLLSRHAELSDVKELAREFQQAALAEGVDQSHATHLAEWGARRLCERIGLHPPDESQQIL